MCDRQDRPLDEESYKDYSTLILQLLRATLTPWTSRGTCRTAIESWLAAKVMASADTEGRGWSRRRGLGAGSIRSRAHALATRVSAATALAASPWHAAG